MTEEEINRRAAVLRVRALELIAAGAGFGELERLLVEEGEPELAARRIAERLRSEREARVEKQKLERARRDMLVGGLSFGLGMLVTVASWETASQRADESYMVAWGAIVFGGFRLMRGISSDRRASTVWIAALAVLTAIPFAILIFGSDGSDDKALSDPRVPEHGVSSVPTGPPPDCRSLCEQGRGHCNEPGLQAQQLCCQRECGPDGGR